ncbi:MAG: hypothetical protein HFE84_08305 [Lachnospiraceae bacterium]|nr:hypothetical protein [Lachnospiraceae bacterium]
MIILKKYQITVKNGIYYAKATEKPVCPVCGSPLKVRDSRRRQMILANGSIRIFLLRRLRCPSCGILHQELPDIFLPHKHYSRDVISRALSGDLPYCPAENSTLYRWEKEMNPGMKGT